MIKIGPFVKAMEKACRDRCKYDVYLGEVTKARPNVPYVLVKLPAAGAGKAGTLGNAADEISFLQPLTVVASTADRLLTVTDDVRSVLDGYELKVGGCHVEPLRLSYSSGLLRDDQVDIPTYGHLFYSVDMWQITAFKRFA